MDNPPNLPPAISFSELRGQSSKLDLALHIIAQFELDSCERFSMGMGQASEDGLDDFDHFENLPYLGDLYGPHTKMGNHYKFFNDNWDKPRRKYRKKLQLDMLSEAIQSNITIGPLDIEYISKYASFIGLSAVSSAADIVNVAKYIPEAILWEFAFNSSVACVTHLDVLRRLSQATTDELLTLPTIEQSLKSQFSQDIPYLRIYKPILGTVEKIAPIIAGSVVAPSVSKEDAVRETSFIDENRRRRPGGFLAGNDYHILYLKPSKAAKTGYVKHTISKALNDIANIDNFSFNWAYKTMKDCYSGPHSPLKNAYFAVEFGALSFVELHELAHVLSGHLDKDWKPYLEFEADQLALSIICASNSSVKFKSLMLAGIFTLFEFIIALEQIGSPEYDISNSLSYKRYSMIQSLATVLFSKLGQVQQIMPEINAVSYVFEETFRNQSFLAKIRKEIPHT